MVEIGRPVGAGGVGWGAVRVGRIYRGPVVVLQSGG